ncbi:restriction endonuclease, partial [Helicobacter didelphidarum]
MITKENFKASLESLGFQHNNDEVYIKIFDDLECELQADFKHSKLLYPKGIIINDATTSNFSKPENFVVFECVHRLLEKGYKPQHLELEPKWQLGREAKSGKADILVKDNEGNSYLLLECKTTDSKNSEFKKEWERMQNNGGQLLSYYQQDKNVKFLCLYTSDFNGENIIFENYILNMQDNEDYLRKNDFKDSYKNANTNEEVFKVWSEIYKYDASSIGIFERNINAYEVGKNALCFEDLKELQSFKDDSKKHEDGKYHEFAKILRKYNISGKENAFDKLVNLFLCKIYDEIHNKNNLKFVYRGVIADSFEDMQDRLMLLYKEAMSEFLKEEVTFIADETIEKAFSALNHNKKSISSLESEVKGFIKALKFYSNNDFAFLEVHNEELFYQNALVLMSVVKLFENLKLTQNKTNQFLGNLFELFLQKGMKQDEGQFFTPVQICEFIMYSLPLQDYIDTKIPKVLDYACGAGHFLNTYANFLQEFCKKENVKEYFSQIYGIEKEYRLSKVAKVSSCMYGQNEINILYADALSSDALESKMNNFSFDILVANPPYSVQGFLETLSEKSRKSYTLFSQQINLETNNNIECFFIERANQLLDDKAITAIILPSSLLNKSGIYEQTREIILQNFDIISIVELGSNTFGATGTNTIILFMQKRISFENDKLNSQRFKFLQERLDYENLINNDNFKENDLLESYISYRGFEPESYKSFLDSILSDEILENENFKEYKQEFLKSASYKKLKDSKIYKDCEDKKALEEKEFVHFCLEREKEKLLYFALSIENEVLIIKSPSENKEQKKFLGYEWSDRKGSEGLKELNTPYLTPLFERGNPDNQNKLSFLIKQSFLKNEFEIPNDLTQYASRARLVDMIDFSKVEFDKAISLSPSRSLRGEAEAIHNPFANYRYPLVKLESICKMYQPKTITSTEILEQGKYKVYGANGIIGYFNEYNHKDSEVAMTCRGATCGTINFTEPESWITGNAMVISPLNSKEVLKKFLIYILPLSNISHIITGSAQPQITKTNLSQLKIPLPPLEIQQQIVSECEKVEEQYKTIRMSIEEYQNLIKAILVNCGVIAQDS